MTPKTADLFLDPRSLLATVGWENTNKKYGKDQVIFTQGDACSTLFFIQNGRVKRTAASATGREAIIGILGINDFFGESCLAALPRRIVSVIALTDCVVAEIERTLMIRILHDNPVFAERFIRYLLNRKARVEEDLIDQILNASEKRLARALLLLSNFGEDAGPDHALTAMSQETLAAIVGTTRGRVSFFMNKFRKLGLVEYNGGIRVHKSLRRVFRNDWGIG